MIPGYPNRSPVGYISDAMIFTERPTRKRQNDVEANGETKKKRSCMAAFKAKMIEIFREGLFAKKQPLPLRPEYTPSRAFTPGAATLVNRRTPVFFKSEQGEFIELEDTGLDSGSDASFEVMLRFLAGNPKAVIRFAITQMNVELVLFLIYVKAWKEQWTGNQDDMIFDDLERSSRVDCYRHAALIYYTLVAIDADFPLNVRHIRRSRLRTIFQYTAYIKDPPPVPTEERSRTPPTVASSAISFRSVHTEVSRAATPWEEPTSPFPALPGAPQLSPTAAQELLTEKPVDLEEAQRKILVLPTDLTRRLVAPNFRQEIHGGLLDEIYVTYEPPDEMSFNVFDETVKDVLSQVYYSVWIPFVKSGEYNYYCPH